MISQELGRKEILSLAPVGRIVCRRAREWEPMRIKLGAAVLVAAALGGCATSLNLVGDPFMAPARFQFLRCEDIAKRLAAAQARDQELRGLMERADTGVWGS